MKNMVIILIVLASVITASVVTYFVTRKYTKQEVVTSIVENGEIPQLSTKGWKPEGDDVYYYVDLGWPKVRSGTWQSYNKHSDLNYFRTKGEAEEVLNKIQEMMRTYH